MMDEFMQMAKANTLRNLETCGVLAGSLVSEDLYTWSKDFFVTFYVKKYICLGRMRTPVYFLASYSLCWK
jgi:hypothetical protein